MIITIDGPAASGKSTAARLLAQKLSASFLDTGAMYRAVTLAAMQASVNMSDEDELLGVIQTNKFEFSVRDDEMSVRINGIDFTEQLRTPQVTANARYIASAPKAREKLVQMQRQFAAGLQKIVTEGRDQGTVAFPYAEIKFYLMADSAHRRKRQKRPKQNSRAVKAGRRCRCY
jgi:cytidylate kinase